MTEVGQDLQSWLVGVVLLATAPGSVSLSGVPLFSVSSPISSLLVDSDSSMVGSISCKYKLLRTLNR